MAWCHENGNSDYINIIQECKYFKDTLGCVFLSTCSGFDYISFVDGIIDKNSFLVNKSVKNIKVFLDSEEDIEGDDTGTLH